MQKEGSAGGLELAGIHDAEIDGYICSKKEMQFRKIMWEMLHRDYSDGKRSKQGLKSKKKALKRGGERKEKEKTTSAVSSKINYDALKKLLEEESPRSQIREEEDCGYNVGGDNGIGDDFDF